VDAVLGVLPSGTFWNHSRGPWPSGSTEARRRCGSPRGCSRRRAPRPTSRTAVGGCRAGSRAPRSRTARARPGRHSRT
jgi:hypothetical protein